MLRLALSLLVFFGSFKAVAQSRIVGDLPRRDGRPAERVEGLETEFGSIRTSEGLKLRTMLTRPAGVTRKLPTIFFVQYVSCGSLEFEGQNQMVLRTLAQKSGMALIRIDRRGVGDSEGKPCSELHYDEEIRHYREAFDQLSGHPWVDSDKVAVFGWSMGAMSAPLVAEGKKVAAIFVQGGGALTYLERMIAFDRLYLERSGKYAPESIHGEMLKRIAFHQEYLLGAKTPEQVVADRPELKGVWESMRGTTEAPPHYGRPYAWHWQAAKKNFLGAWMTVDAPVLVIHGQFDQFEPQHSHKIITETLNQRHPGSAKFVQLDRFDHSLRRFPDQYAAYAETDPELARDVFITIVVDWLKAVGLR